jgi:hypothetical protein
MKTANPYLKAGRDVFYLKFVILFFIIWIFATKPLRRIPHHTAFASGWLAGVAPDFFAGIVFVFWQTYLTRTKPFISFLFAVLMVMLSEFIQLFLPGYVADWNDIVAGIVGAALAAFFVFIRSKRK